MAYGENTVFKRDIRIALGVSKTFGGSSILSSPVRIKKPENVLFSGFFSDSRNIVLKYFSKLAFVLYGGEGIGFLLLIILIVTGNTMLPRWFFIITPGMLFMLKPLVSRLPKGVRVIISGGWSNLISVIYFSAVLIFGIIK